jgi:hypothetical protein
MPTIALCLLVPQQILLPPQKIFEHKVFSDVLDNIEVLDCRYGDRSEYLVLLYSEGKSLNIMIFFLNGVNCCIKKSLGCSIKDNNHFAKYRLLLERDTLYYTDDNSIRSFTIDVRTRRVSDSKLFQKLDYGVYGLLNSKTILRYNYTTLDTIDVSSRKLVKSYEIRDAKKIIVNSTASCIASFGQSDNSITFFEGCTVRKTSAESEVLSISFLDEKKYAVTFSSGRFAIYIGGKLESDFPKASRKSVVSLHTNANCKYYVSITTDDCDIGNIRLFRKSDGVFEGSFFPMVKASLFHHYQRTPF